ncbi:hypothetical protein NDU88_005738 [Pleurodeles waltl]|uniref:Uncharacterized protein n=1 Tax=Pleurodeles waltl TaxID=8319 RepID=A0AAV7N1E6_PLEWA|nr:hypothetical protein NDU88_005738 [Pleurodeles waltl]
MGSAWARGRGQAVDHGGRELKELRAGDASQVIGREPDRRQDTLVLSADSLEWCAEELGRSCVARPAR